jgi:2-oxoisovalerate dehydrogenase E1 component
VFNTPIAEAGIVGRALGMAVRGLIPVAEIQFFDYIWPAMHQLRNELSVLRWRSNNGFAAPVVLRVPIGGYLTGGGPYHSQSGVSIFAQCPGLRIVMPANARDAVGLLRTAVRCGDPVLFFEHKHLYRQPYAKAVDPGPDYVIPLGRARTVRAGRDLTVVTYGALVEKSLRAAEEAAADGVEAEVIDLRSLQPYDWDAIRDSVRRTNRAIVAYEDCRSHGFGAEIAARIAEELFSDLDAPVARVASLDAPVAYAPALEQATLPEVADITAAIRSVRSF